jgi:hypothetical protein
MRPKIRSGKRRQERGGGVSSGIAATDVFRHDVGHGEPKRAMVEKKRWDDRMVWTGILSQALRRRG